MKTVNVYKRIVSFVLCFVLLICSVSAAPIDRIKADLKTGEITVNGKFDGEAKKRVALKAVNKEEPFEVVMIDTVLTSGDGSYEYSFEVDNVNAKYELQAGILSSEIFTGDFIYVPFNELTQSIINCKDANEMKLLTEQFYDSINLDISDYKKVIEPVKVFESIISCYTLGQIDDFKSAFLKETQAALIRENSSYLTEYLAREDDVLQIKNKPYYSFFEKNDTVKNLVMADLAIIKPASSNAFAESFARSTILNTVYRPNTWSEIKLLFEKNYELIGLASSDLKVLDIVYKRLSGQKFLNYEDLKAKFMEYKASSSDVSSSNEPKYSGGGNSGGSSKDHVSNVSGNLDSFLDSMPYSEVNTYVDISQHFAENSIYALLNKGILNMSSDKLFRPNDNITREEFLKMLVVSLDLLDKNAECEFTDVSKDAWSYGYIATAKQLGITNGISQNEFGAKINIIRQDMVTLISKALSVKGIKLSKVNELKKFADMDLVSEYAKQAVMDMQTAGIVNGKGEMIFDPQAHATRGECAVMINNLLSAIERGE